MALHIPARFPSLEETAATFRIPKDRVRELITMMDEIRAKQGAGRSKPAKAKAGRKMVGKRAKGGKRAKSRSTLAETGFSA